MKAIIGGILYYRGKLEKDLALIYNEEIIDIIPIKDFDSYLVDEIIELDQEYILPGFIDVHIHGYGGKDVMDGSTQGLQTISKDILQNGVTSFLPTSMTMPKEDIEKAIINVGKMIGKDIDGARLLGLHMEGPYISKEKRGAQLEKYIVVADHELILKYKDIIKIITIGPEVEGAMELIEKYSKKFIFSLGHTLANYETAKLAIEKGAKSVTHLFNGMSGLNHRDPGLVGAALTSDCYVEIICDDYHINSSVYQIVLDTKGYDKILLITDSMRAGGLEDGIYDLGGQEVSVRDGKCRLEDGTIAGSILAFNDAVKNFYKGTDISLEHLFSMTSKNQAEYLGIDDKVGSIEKGKLADLVVLNKKLDVEYTIVGGRLLYRK